MAIVKALIRDHVFWVDVLAMEHDELTEAMDGATKLCGWGTICVGHHMRGLGL